MMVVYKELREYIVAVLDIFVLYVKSFGSQSMAANRCVMLGSILYQMVPGSSSVSLKVQDIPYHPDYVSPSWTYRLFHRLNQHLDTLDPTSNADQEWMDRILDRLVEIMVGQGGVRWDMGFWSTQSLRGCWYRWVLGRQFGVMGDRVRRVLDQKTGRFLRLVAGMDANDEGTKRTGSKQ
jgi:hypothetical protein